MKIRVVINNKPVVSQQLTEKEFFKFIDLSKEEWNALSELDKKLMVACILFTDGGLLDLQIDERSPQADKAQQQYSVPDGDKMRTCSFQDVWDEYAQLEVMATRAGLYAKPIDSFQLGNLNLLQELGLLWARVADTGTYLGAWLHPKASQEVKNKLLQSMNRGHEIRLFYGNPDTGFVYLETADVIGKIRLNNKVKNELMFANSGAAIIAQNILRIVDLKQATVLYSHPKFSVPVFTIDENAGKLIVSRYDFEASVEGLGLSVGVDMNNPQAVEAEFLTYSDAERFLDFFRNSTKRIPQSMRITNAPKAAQD